MIVLKYTFLDELGRVPSLDEVRVELFVRYSDAYARITDIAKEWFTKNNMVISFSDTEELSEILLDLADDGIPSIDFDISKVEVPAVKAD